MPGRLTARDSQTGSNATAGSCRFPYVRNGSESSVRGRNVMMLASFLALLDKVRRGAGQALDVADPGPVEAPFRIAIELSGAWLGAHQPPGTAPRGPILLIIPAPVKRAYIWDLLPEVSVVRHCLRRGLRV